MSRPDDLSPPRVAVTPQHPGHPVSSPPPPSLRRLWAVVRDNPDFRRLALASLVSQTGDWFDAVALFSLLLQLTGKAESVSFVLVARSLPMVLTGPWAGVLADRLDRRFLMVVSDLGRALLVLGLLLVRTPQDAPIAYLVIALHSVLSIVFEPAQQAVFPNLVRREDLVVASALENTLWSVCLALGSALGGLSMAALGRDATFVFDSLTFVISALLIHGLPDRIRRPVPSEGSPEGNHGEQGSFVEGARYVLSQPRVLALILVKAGFGLTLGGVLVLLAYFGEFVFGGAGSQVAALWTARGVGSFAGPLVAYWLGGDSELALRKGIAGSLAMIGASYLVFSQAPNLAVAVVALMVANAGGSVLWTFGSSLINQLVPDAFRGRVGSTDMGFITLTMTVSTLLVGQLLDGGVSARTLMAGCGLVALVPIAYWALAQRHFGQAGLQPTQVSR